MVRLIPRERGGLAALKLTKLFGINDFPASKDSGKVLIIIIYCYLIINLLCVESESNHSQYSSPVEALNLIVESTSLPGEVNDLNSELYFPVEVKEKPYCSVDFDFLASVRSYHNTRADENVY